MKDLFVVSAENCSRCGRCAAVCPARVIELAEKYPVPVPDAEAEQSCISCGHCVAVCPSGALAHRRMSPAQCPQIRRESHLSAFEVEHFLRSRRSTRVYTTRTAGRDLLARLIGVANYAPSGHNSQTVCWRIVPEPQVVRQLAGHVIDWMRHTTQEAPEMANSLGMERVVAAWDKGIDRVCRSAPHLLMVHGAKDDRFAPNSCPIALAYLELAAPSFGLGTCWAGYFTAATRSWGPLKDALGLPDRHVVFGAVLVGYPQFRYHRLPLRNTPRITWHGAVDAARNEP